MRQRVAAIRRGNMGTIRNFEKIRRDGQVIDEQMTMAQIIEPDGRNAMFQLDIDGTTGRVVDVCPIR